MVLLTALIAIIGGNSIGAVFGAFTAPMWIEAATTLISMAPQAIQVLEVAIPAFAGVGKLIASGIDAVVLAPLMSEGFKKWVAENGDMAIKMQNQRDKDY